MSTEDSFPNLCVKLCWPLHCDKNNQGSSFVRAIGHHTGGDLLYWARDPQTVSWDDFLLKKAGILKMVPQTTRIDDDGAVSVGERALRMLHLLLLEDINVPDLGAMRIMHVLVFCLVRNIAYCFQRSVRDALHCL